jgi:threonine/homoserine/homoserine lactone efflux protein
MEAPGTFFAGCAVILVAPGPTNFLLAAAAVSDRVRAFRLIPAVVVGYATTVTVLVRLGESAPPKYHFFLQMVASLYLGWLAWLLWRSDRATEHGSLITFPRVFVTTLTNPKCFVIAFAVLPLATQTGQIDLLTELSILGVVSAFSSAGWISVGLIVNAVSGESAARMLYRPLALMIGSIAMLNAGVALMNLPTLSRSSTAAHQSQGHPRSP